MAIREGPWQSKNDHDFILRALRSGRRADGRKLGDMRMLRMVFARAEGQASAEIQLGRTRVLGVVTGEVPRKSTREVVCYGLVSPVRCVGVLFALLCCTRGYGGTSCRWRPLLLVSSNEVSRISNWFGLSVVPGEGRASAPMIQLLLQGRLLAGGG